MPWGRWLLVAGLAVLAAAGATVVATNDLATAQADEDASPMAVMRAPLDGDAATYTHRYPGLAEERELDQGWNGTEFQLPDGSQVTLASHQTFWTQNLVTTTEEDKDEDALVRAFGFTPPADALRNTDLVGEQAEAESHALAMVSERGFTQLPGEPDVHRTIITTTSEQEDTTSFHHSERTEIKDDPSCWGPTGPLLVERTPAEAERIIEDCTETWLTRSKVDDFAIDVTSRWTSTDSFDNVWQVNITVERTLDNETRASKTTLQTSPSASLILYKHTQTEHPEQDSNRTYEIELETWEQGEEELPTDHEPLATMPSVALVDWTPTGPTEGDLDLFSLEEASAAVERTSEGNGYFADAEDPRIRYAQFIDEERNGQTIASRSSVNGAPCEDESYPRHALPAAADRLHWDIVWQDLDEGELWGRATAPRGAQENLDDQVPHERASASHSEGLFLAQLRPALEGPSLAELWEARELVGAFDEEGSRTIGVQPHLVPLEEEDEQALEGFVRRISCQQTQNTVEFDSTRITFTDGLARELEISTYTRTSDDTGGWPGLDAPDELEAGLAR